MSGRWEGGGALLEPIAGGGPCGQNLEDTTLLASFDAFRLFGQAAPLDPPPDWREIRDKALEALTRSKDLRLLAHLASASLRTDGLAPFAELLTVAAHWLETYWSETYPAIDEDAVLRRSALNCFADQMAVVDGVRRAPLVSSRQHGTFSLRDIEIAAGQASAGDGEPRPDPGQIDAAFAAAPLEALVTLQQRVAAAREALQRIDGRMRAEGGPEAAPSLDPLAAQFLKVDRVLRAQLARRPDAPAAGEAGGESSGGGDAAAAAPGAIRSRQDAIRALEAVAAFFRQTEPSSPVPLFLDRAKRLVSKDFLEVLADVAPEAVAQARAAGGLRQDE